jgi:hypothetical protein
VTITGTAFTGATKVQFNGKSASKPSADKVPKVIWLDSGRVCEYKTRRAAEFAADEIGLAGPGRGHRWAPG